MPLPSRSKCRLNWAPSRKPWTPFNSVAEHLDFDMDRFLYYLDQVHPGVEHMLMSARTGEGVDAWREWLGGVAHRQRVAA